MVLKHRLKGVQPPFSQSTAEMTSADKEHEMALIMGGVMDDEIRDRELQAHTDRIKNLEAELQKARSEAYQAGYQEGQKIAKSESRKQFGQLSREFNENIQSIYTEFTDTLEQLSHPLLKLALGVSERIIQRELNLGEQSREILMLQVQKILNETVTQTRAVIQVNPTQLDWITGSDNLKILNIANGTNLRFIPNPKLHPGECKLETEDYLVDSTIRAQLSALEKVLEENDAANSI